MGLDMYATSMRSKPARPVDFEVEDSADDLSEIHYWRKHPNLHGWMEKLYREHNGADTSFNCVNVELTESDLTRLESDIKACGLPDTSGFFFGATDGSEVTDDLEFIAKAREQLSGGRFVYYTSSW